jgi:EAL domain-containing protein (putative c-di-GMP-specific phosphodiesterase class I)
VSVNISARCLQDDSLPEQVLTCLSANGLAPRQLTLEITESTMTRHPDITSARLNRLREAGILIAIDDFGTGYSTMSTLSVLPVDAIKIDRTFVTRCAEQPTARAILQAIIQLATAMNLKVIAEGIETEQQRQTLMSVGSDCGQGYLFYRPLTVEQLEAVLAESCAAQHATSLAS